jgi:hypothetical protein
MTHFFKENETALNSGAVFFISEEDSDPVLRRGQDE